MASRAVHCATQTRGTSIGRQVVFGGGLGTWLKAAAVLYAQFHHSSSFATSPSPGGVLGNSWLQCLDPKGGANIMHHASDSNSYIWSQVPRHMNADRR